MQTHEQHVPLALSVTQNRKPWATVSLLVLFWVLFVVEHFGKLGAKSEGLFGIDAQSLYALGAMSSEALRKNGEWYRLLSATLFHVDAIHILLNSLAFFFVGFLLESMVGAAWLVNLFFIGAIGGSFAGYLVNPPELVSVGASGGIMGLLASALVLTLRYPAGSQRTQIQITLARFLIPSLIPLATMGRGVRIDYAAHIGGAIAGTIGGFIVYLLWTNTEILPKFSVATKVVTLVVVLGYSTSLSTAYAHYQTAKMELSYFDLVVDDAAIPQDPNVAVSTVDTWGKDKPRDPRVCYFRAMKLWKQGDAKTAEVELRNALQEREILKNIFPDKKLELVLRATLAEVVASQGRLEDAKQEAAQPCRFAEPDLIQELTGYGLCSTQ